jgi:hypothetical protein
MNFITPDGTPATSDQNWRNLIQNVYQGSWNALPATNFPTGATAANTYPYSANAITAIMFFHVILHGVTAWNTNQYINLPRQLATISKGSAAPLQQITAIPLINTTTGASLGNLTIQRGSGSTAVLINLGANITPIAVDVSVQGFYFTGK